MAISFVGSTAGLVGATATTVNFSALLNSAGSTPTLAPNDIVIICQSRRSAGAAANTAPTGYSTLTLSGAVTNLFADNTDDTNMSVFYKIMGPAPDTSVVINSPGSTQVSSYTIHVLRGVDTTTPFDGVTPTTVTQITTGAPNPAAITPATTGAWVMVWAGCASANSAGSNTVFTAPSNIDTTTNTFRAASGTRTGTAGGLFSSWASGAFDPNAFGGGIVTSGGSSAAITAAIRPATGATTHDGSGALAGQLGSVSGSAAHNAPHTASGTLTGQLGSVAGSAARTRQHAASGALSGQIGSVSGSATRFRSFSAAGVLTGQGSALTASAARFRAFGASGDLLGAGAQVIGSAATVGGSIWTPGAAPSVTWTKEAGASGAWSITAGPAGTWTTESNPTSIWTIKPTPSNRLG